MSMMRARKGMMIFSAEFFTLVLLLSFVKSEEYCKLGDRHTVTRPFRLLISGISPLDNNIFPGLIIESLMSCSLQCLAQKFCVGFNFKKKPKENKINCQLTTSLDHKFDDDNEEKDWDFYQGIGPRKSSCKEESPCKNGGEELPKLSHPGYSCLCPSRFSGNHCETEKDLLSPILGNLENDQILQSWIGSSYKANLCWNATADGWGAPTFHSNCDDKEPTVTIVKVGNYIFGGYTTSTWTGAGISKKAPGSFVFSFENKENLPPFKAPLKDENSNYAIFAGGNFGPTFGDRDIYVSTDAASNAYSYSVFNTTYLAPPNVSEPSTIFAGSQYFTPSEIEVFHLVLKTK